MDRLVQLKGKNASVASADVYLLQKGLLQKAVFVNAAHVRDGSGTEVPMTLRQCLPLDARQTGSAKKRTFRASVRQDFKPRHSPAPGCGKDAPVRQYGTGPPDHPAGPAGAGARGGLYNRLP